MVQLTSGENFLIFNEETPKKKPINEATDPPSICQTYGKELKNVKLLRKHLETHIVELCKCNICEKSFQAK